MTVASAIACVIVPGAVIPPSAMVVPEGGETAALPCRDFAVRLAGAGRHAHFRGERQAHISRRARGTAVAAGYTRYDEPSNNECAEPAARSAPSITGVHEMPPPIDWS